MTILEMVTEPNEHLVVHSILRHRAKIDAIDHAYLVASAELADCLTDALRQRYCPTAQLPDRPATTALEVALAAIKGAENVRPAS